MASKSKAKALAFLGAGALGVGLLIATSGKEAQAASTSTTKAGLQKSAIGWASKFGVPPSLFLAVLNNENSRFQVDAVNRTPAAAARGNAWGLAQVTLATAKGITTQYPTIAKAYWPAWDGSGDGLLAPDVNLAMGAFILSQSWKRYASSGQRWLAAGLAYEQGMGNVDKFIKAGNGTIDPTKLPPVGKGYWTSLERQLSGTTLVASLRKAELAAGALT